MFYKGFAVGGAVNVTVLDPGLVSLVEEPVKIRAILIMTNEAQGNTVEGWIGTERILEIPDYLLDTNDDQVSTNPQRATTKINRIPIEEPIPPGQIFKIGIRCGANATNIYGSYEYEPAAV